MMLLLSLEKEEKYFPEDVVCIEEVINYLTKLNDNIMVYVKKIYTDSKCGAKIFEMSNGLSCRKNEEGKWIFV